MIESISRKGEISMDSIIRMFYAEVETDIAKELINGSEYNRLRDEISERFRQIESELSSKGKKCLMQMDDLQGKLYVLESDINFSYGFRCGLNLLWKIGWEQLITGGMECTPM